MPSHSDLLAAWSPLKSAPEHAGVPVHVSPAPSVMFPAVVDKVTPAAAVIDIVSPAAMDSEPEEVMAMLPLFAGLACCGVTMEKSPCADKRSSAWASSVKSPPVVTSSVDESMVIAPAAALMISCPFVPPADRLMSPA